MSQKSQKDMHVKIDITCIQNQGGNAAMDNTVLLQEMKSLENIAGRLLEYDSSHFDRTEIIHLLKQSQALIETFEVMVTLSGGASSAQKDQYNRELLSNLEEIEEIIGDKHFLTPEITLLHTIS